MSSALINVDYLMTGLGSRGYFHTSQFLLWCFTAVITSANLNLYIFSVIHTVPLCLLVVCDTEMAMISSAVNVDRILAQLGNWKMFHLTQFAMLCFSSIIQAANGNVFVFTSLQTKYRCNNLTEEQLIQYNVSYSQADIIYDECTISIARDKDIYPRHNETLPCLNGYYYTTREDRSIVSKWDLICHKTGMAELTQTLYVIGQLISGICSPIFIEKFGRKPVHIWANIVLLGINLVCAFNTYFWVFAIMRFLNGITNDCFLVSCLTAVVELFPKEKRLLMTGIFSFIWSSLNVVSGLVAYLLKDYSWTALAFFNCAISGFFIVEVIFLEESIRWLFAHGKMERAEKVLRRAARQNKINFDNIWKNYVIDISLDKTVDKDTDSAVENSTICKDISTKGTVQYANGVTDCNPQLPDVETTPPKEPTRVWIQLGNIFKMPYLRKITLVVMIIWIVDATTYNGLYLLSEVLGGSLYFNFTVMSLAETAAALVYAYTLTRFGHKISLFASKMFGGLCLLVAAFLKLFGKVTKTNDTVFVAFNLTAMFGIGAGYGGNYIYTPELYPTSMRSVGLGLSSSVSRLVVMGVPFLRLLALEYPWMPALLMGTGCTSTAVLLMVMLPETKNKTLPQTIEELDRMQQEKKAKRSSVCPSPCQS